MGTKIRTELSKKNEFYISKERRLELTHFARQYDDWWKKVEEIEAQMVRAQSFENSKVDGGKVPNPTEALASALRIYHRHIAIIGESVEDALYYCGLETIYNPGSEEWEKVYHKIFRLVTKGGSYESLGLEDYISKYQYKRLVQCFYWRLDARRL